MTTSVTFQLPTSVPTQGLPIGQFIWPIGVAVDSSANVYVTDGYNHRVSKFGRVLTIPVEHIVLIIVIAVGSAELT